DPEADRATRAAAAAGPDAGTVPFDLDALDAAGALDGAVVASPTVHHATQAEALLAVAPRLLVEKPLAPDVRAAAALTAHADRVAVAYNLRFHEPVQRLVGLVADGAAGSVTGVRLWFGSWLPDWRPQVDYRTTYSARADLGGGVLLDAIHELDLLVWLCGPGPHEVVGAVVDRLGPLEIDVEDTVTAVVRTAGGPVATVALDYLARRYRRGVEVTGDRATVRLDWARSVIEVEDGDGVRSEAADTPVPRSYQRQAAAFLDWVGNGPALPVDAATGAASLALADAIRAAAT
ncbi:MAG TPA: Gfo/Idh/MocA family oxidoreductase, partial [Iamia sp.]